MSLNAHGDRLRKQHLRELMANAERTKSLFSACSSTYIALDYSRQKLDQEALTALLDFAKSQKLESKIAAMFNGEQINSTEKRAVLHTALRTTPDDCDGFDPKIVKDVDDVRNSVFAFADKVRSGELKGSTGKTLTDVLCIGIGGSFLGVEFAFEALRFEPTAEKAAAGRRLKFLANVDPLDVRRALDGLNAETTLVVVISKTFTTAETMLNAKTAKKWLIDSLGESAIGNHLAAVSTALDKTKEFGVRDENVFGFWDWVGGRFSVTSAVGLVPLALQFGPSIVKDFLAGARLMDKHYRNEPLEKNLPVLMGLLAYWNFTVMGYRSTAVLPYSQALHKLAPHIQQLDMESNGKRVTLSGAPVPCSTGAVHFGEPGTNGQHSFYQLLHQGVDVIPCEFIGFAWSQNEIKLDGEPVSNHDELMSNFFAQPDALAYGKTAEEVRASGVPEELVEHKVFPGDRPSLQLLIPKLDAKYLGSILALYEHRTATQGFLWDINSFDQWGVELGKVLAKDVRGTLQQARAGERDFSKYNESTQRLLQFYLHK